MKFFIGITTAEELKEAFRSFCLRMHPDCGGDAEEFKEMQAEYERLSGTKQFHMETAEEREEREEAERYAAEERARREQEEREKEERIRKAQEETRRLVQEWADRLERLTQTTDESKLRYYRFKDKQEAAAYVAVTKRNVKAVINHYYPNLKVKVSISGAIWKEVFTVSWEDGPGEDALEKTCKELSLFIPSYYVCAGPWEDYGHHEENKATAPWREAYGSALGDTTDIKFERTLSDDGKAQAEALAASIFEHWLDNGDGAMFEASLSEWLKLAEAFGREKDKYGTYDTRGMEWSHYSQGERYDDSRGSVADFYRSRVRELIYSDAPVNVDEKAKQARKEAEFKPKYGKALAALYKLTGVGKENVVFWWKEVKGVRNWESHTLTTEEAIEKMLAGEKVYFGTEHRYDDGSVSHWGTRNGGYKTQKKRAEKWQAEGYTLTGIGYGNTMSYVSICGVTPEVAAAVRKDLKHVERQREAWERNLSPDPSPAREGNQEGEGDEIEKVKDENEKLTIKNEKTMSTEKNQNAAIAATENTENTEGTEKKGAPKKSEAPRLTYSTYEKTKTNKKTGKPYKVTHAKIMGFSDTDEAYKNGVELHGSASYESVDGKRVYGLYFGHRYAEAAKQVCETLNAGGTLADCKAIIAAASEANAKKHEGWRAKVAEWQKQREAKKAAKSSNGKASDTAAEKTYTMTEIAAMMQRALAGEDVPELAAVKEALKAA